MPRFAFLLLAARAFCAPSLMPLPAHVSYGTGALVIDSNFSIGYSQPWLRDAAARLTDRISRQTGILFFPNSAPPALTIDCGARGPEMPTLGEDESYRLDVTPSGARLSAPTLTGAVRGMETFAQLIEGGKVAAVHIEDSPRFPWRGLMLDVSRHWMPADVVRRNLNAMAAVKLNVFHWHLADDQGFRVESRRYPKLHELGSDGHFYTQAEVRDLVAYAAARRIRVVPEFDIPGHTTAWFVGYPELASAPGPYTIERAWGIFQPTMDPSRESTFTFLDGLLGEMASLFPDPYFHIGGDEVEDTQWKNSPAIQSFAREHGLKSSHEIEAYFVRRVQALLTKHGKSMVGWDEILSPGLAEGAVIQSWRGPESIADAASKGYRGILSYGYYLDHMKPASFHYEFQPPDGSLGGEACMWNEYTSPETVDSRIWPRMAVIAERFWSARDVGDAKSMYDRMEAVSRKLEWTGVRHRAARRPMLERLGGDTAALEVLADASEATGITVRRDARKYTSPVPLNRFVDAVRPESETVRRLEIAARTNPNAELRATFRTWSEIEPRIDIVELKSLSHNMALAGSIGLRALDLLQSGQAPPENWISEQDRILAAMAKPQAEVVLAAARPVRALLARWNKKAASVASRLPPAPEPRPPAPPRASAATDSTHVRSGNEHVVPHPQRF